MRHELVEGAGDWAVRTSTVARDVFYYRNLNLGQRLTATLRRFDRVGENIILHTSLTAESDGAALAAIFTAKRVLL
jgi:probable biosynthetic protein (TIGR04098 family)